MTQAQVENNPSEGATALLRWREQAEQGGLPVPHRSRWQPLRVGVVNLWEFDRAEAWFADGRLQLAGANETGKSTLMTLTTLLLFAGDVSSYNIDTLGSSTKRFRFYIEPSEHTLDRREKNAKKYRGWAWAEYGRLTQDGPEFFTTLLFAQARTGDNDIPPTWCTLLGSHRVRSGLTLVESGYPVDPGQVKTVTGFEQHTSGEKYRAAIARTMFDGDTAVLTQLTRVLRVLRTPKIGARFDMDNLATAFRHALPAVDDSEIEQLSQDWDELERMRTEQDNAEQALAAITQFISKYWLPWAHSEIRQAADPVLASHNSLTAALKKEKREQSTLDTCTANLETIDGNITEAEGNRQKAQTQKDALHKSQEYLTAASATASARSLAVQASKAEVRAELAQGRLKSAGTHLSEARSHRDTAQGDATAATETVQQTGHAVMSSAAEAGCGTLAEELVQRRDIARLHHLTTHRQQLLDHLRGLFTQQSQAEQLDEHADSQLSRNKSQHLKAQEASDKAEADVDEAVAALAHDLSGWATQLPENPPSADLVEKWMAQVATIAGAAQPGPVLRELLLRQHFLPTQSDLTGQQQRQRQELTAAQATQVKVALEIDTLSKESEPSPLQPALWSRRPRSAGITESGAPLWRLVDPMPATTQEQVAVLEAALDAAGLLQAWITPDGTYRQAREGHEVVWQLEAADSTPEGAPGHAPAPALVGIPEQDTLRSVLAPAADIPAELATVVDRLLCGVAYIDTLQDHPEPDGKDHPPTTSSSQATARPASGTQRAVIAADGHWHLAGLRGQAAPAGEGAQLLGTAAREAARQRRLKHLRTELAIAETQVEEFTAALAALTRRLETLATAYRTSPSDTAVVSSVHAARQAAALLKASAGELRRAQEAKTAAQKALEEATREITLYASEHEMPRHAEGLNSVASAVAALRTSIGEFNAAAQQEITLSAALTRAQETLGRCEAEFSSETKAAGTAQEEAEALRTEAEEARAALSLDGQGVLERAAALETAITGHTTTLRTLREQQRALLEERIAAQSDLDTTARHRHAVQTTHGEAVAYWWQHLDAALPALCGISASPDRTPEAALGDAESAARLIPIPGWEPGTAQAATHARRKWEALTGQLPALRSRLEALSSRTANLSEPNDSNPAQLPTVELIIDGSGRPYAPPVAARTLQEQLAQLKANYDAEFDHAINELLGSTFVEHLRDRLVEVESLRKSINTKLKASPTTTSALTLRLTRVPVSAERDANEVLQVLEEESVTFLPAATQHTIKQFLAGRVAEAQEAARAHGETDWRKRLEHTLDYRRWFDLKLEYRTASAAKPNWIPLERAEHDTFSGGARVVTLLAPFIAALQAMYDQHPNAPRLMWLDEAFDGVDPPNKTALFRLLRACDLDWMMAGPGMLANNPEVPLAAIVTTCRAPKPLPGVFLETMLWNGKTTSHITTPDPADLPELHRALPAGGQAITVEDGLFDSPR
ncbi:MULTISPECIES: SbcC/MukB-like Walker B domain-containing protein [unclassified Crossiella]|uniref:SbcC/MukB-like Walker B domain-containing protein n=1 Tax=unclassified Crossiella TaxID=2620835 RepID=UPI001FFF55FB|nr:MULTISPECIES: SbcC/MukB-like Walker B domain-containing protein [unclassified Crossiella]MCK2245203.1 hypothetical protein [Crossiella sp. S99.2]MCK2258875.1 hypothetical protein [Crossiella sp. S99.1]